MPEEIITAKHFRLGLNLKDELTGVTIAMRKLEADLPHKVLFGTLINEIDKQIAHVPAWIRQEYKLRKRDVNF